MSGSRWDGDGVLRIVRTEGRSMEPLIRQGAQIGIVAVPAEQLAVGELAAFTAAGRTIVHRVIATRREDGRLFLREKGDANTTSTWIGAEQVLGRAVWMTAGGVVRRLATPNSRRAAACLAVASRVEADIARLARRMLPFRSAAALSRPARAAFLPFKAAGLPLLAAAYPVVRLDEGPELDFLLACFRAEQALPGNAVATDLDGVFILQGAAWHGIAPAVLQAAGNRLPPQILDALRRGRLRDGLDRLHSLATLREAVEALRRTDIAYVVLKGPALAGLHPGGERPTADLDILVAERDVERAAGALADAGYAARCGAFNRSRFHFHEVLEPRAKGRLPIELHWDLVDRVNLHRVVAAEVLARRRELCQDGVVFCVPAPEDEFLYLALHAAKHGIFNRAGLRDGRSPAWFCRPILGNRLLWFSDLELFLSSRGAALDWRAMRDRAGRWNIEEEVAQSLGVLQRLLPGAEADAALARLGLEAYAASAPGPGQPDCDSAFWRWLLAGMMKMHGGLHFRPARLAGLARVLAPSPTRLRRYWHPVSQAPLALLYLRHPFHIVRKVFSRGDAARAG